jgi:tryptophan 2,3-dioxygenase
MTPRPWTRAAPGEGRAEPSLWDACLWQLTEGLVTHDELAALWRARHVQMVERQIGTKSGTGGSAGAPYLRGRVPIQYYPLLWELRGRL